MKYVMEEALNNSRNSLDEVESQLWKDVLKTGTMKITRDRGKWLKVKNFNIMATFHPAALFRDESKKKLFWQDLKSVKEKLEKLN